MNYTVAVFGGVMVLSLIYYYLPKYGGKHWFTGPIANVDMADSSSDSFDAEKKGNARIDTVEA